MQPHPRHDCRFGCGTARVLYRGGSPRLGRRFEVADTTCHLRVGGRLLYKDYRAAFGSDGKFSMIADRPIRRVPVEIWTTSGAKRVAHTDDSGNFDV